MGSILSSDYLNFDIERTFILCDTATGNNKKPNTQNILDQLFELSEVVGENDSLLIMFSGHGIKRNETGYWIPMDGKTDKPPTWISANNILESFLEYKNIKHLLLVIDCCFSSSILGNSFEKQHLPGTRFALTSGRDKPVLDIHVGEHSPFARAFIEILENNTSKIGVGGLVKLITNKLGSYQLPIPQTPLLTPIQADNDNPEEFEFVNKLFSEAIPDSKAMREAFYEMEINLLKGYLDGEPFLVPAESEFNKKRPTNTPNISLVALQGHPQGGHALVAQKLVRYLNVNNLEKSMFRHISLGIKTGLNRLDVWSGIATDFKIPLKDGIGIETDKTVLSGIITAWLKEQDVALLIELTGDYSDNLLPLNQSIEQFLNDLEDLLPPLLKHKIFVFLMDKRNVETKKELKLSTRQDGRGFVMVLPEIVSFTSDDLVKWSERFEDNPLVHTPIFKAIPFSSFDKESCFVENAVIKICNLCKIPNSRNHPVTKIFLNKTFSQINTANET
ncbi:MAG: caspase family protein [Saprospiraceae bacterium]|nr:caspase family protein [Saprospiraceae bacterium]